MELRSGRLMALAGALAALAAWWPLAWAGLAQAKMKFAAMAGNEARVNMRSAHPLAKWVRDKRKEKRKAKIAAASRRRNRK